MPITRQAQIDALRTALAELPTALAAWEAGSAAFGADDDMSDVDVAVVSADKEGVVVACGDGVGVRLTILQRAGGKRLPAAAFLAGTPIARGDRLGD